MIIVTACDRITERIADIEVGADDHQVKLYHLEKALYAHGGEVESDAIEAHVSRLRAKLGRRAVQMVRGFGYRIGRG